jgi:MFS family permease
MLITGCQTILLPQPSSSPYDPLNWSPYRKHLMLFIVAFTGFLADFASAAGVPLIQVQGQYWHMSPNKVNYAGNLNVAFIAIGGIFWATVSSFWGRLPVMFWATFLGAICTVICASTTNFQVFYAFRTLMGFTLVAFQTVGLASVKDMFFFHEHARKIGIWVAFFIVSPYLSPLFAYFILAGTGNNSPEKGDWRAVLYLVFGIICLDLILIVAFADETYYNRTISVEEQPPRGSRIMRLLGLWQLKNRGYFPTAWKSVVNTVSLLGNPIVIPALIY